MAKIHPGGSTWYFQIDSYRVSTAGYCKVLKTLQYSHAFLCVQLAKFVQHVPDVMSSQAISTNYSTVVPDARSNKRVCDEVKDLLNSLKHGIDQCAEAELGP